MLINKFLLSTYAKRFKKIDFFQKNPLEVQLAVFSRLVEAAKNTQWGRQYNYNSIANVEIFQQRLPLQTYEDVKPYIDRVRRGEQNILWSTPVKWFSKSSGTTGSKSKFIPVTRESLNHCHFRGSKDVVMSYIRHNPTTKMLLGKSLTLGGSHQLDELSTSAKSGDLSAILIQNTPFFINIGRSPKRKTALISDFETKLRKIAEETVKQNITSFAGVPSWNLVLMKYILDYAGKTNLLELWPNLCLFMHGGISFEPYREQFAAIIPSPTMSYMETYNASEGFFALQDDLSDKGMLLMLDLGIFYEFIPMSQLHKANPTIYTVGEVKVGESYAMIISTNSGLWRYQIGDTIEFTSLYPHKIKITGRTKHYINAFGEELMVHNTEQALRVACEKTGVLVREYTVAPVYMDGRSKGRHEWIMEFEKAPSDFEAFSTVLDMEICAVNSDYEAKRAKNVTLNNLIVMEVPEGTFYEWMRHRGKLGGQNKVPRLFNTREYADQLLAIAKELL